MLAVRMYLRGLILIAVGIGSGVCAMSAQAAASFYSAVDSAGLVDQHSTPVEHAALAGRTVLVQFIFTRCSAICPLQTRALVELQASLPAALKPRTRFLSVSLDPLSDTPTQLQAYAKRFGIEQSDWTLATGRPDGIERLATTLGLYGAAVAPYKVEEHGTNLWLVDGQGQVRQRYSGTTPDLGRLRQEIAQVDALSHASTTRR